MIKTGHPVIMTIIPVVVAQKNAAHIAVGWDVVSKKNDFAASTMEG
jgi:hypothetical protein